MRISFLEVAAIELDEARHYYNNELPGLGDVFLTEVLKCLDRIASFPHSWQLCSKRTRRCQTRRFPTALYQVRNEEILVVAVANLHRKPEYWRDRI